MRNRQVLDAWIIDEIRRREQRRREQEEQERPRIELPLYEPQQREEAPESPPPRVIEIQL